MLSVSERQWKHMGYIVLEKIIVYLLISKNSISFGSDLFQFRSSPGRFRIEPNANGRKTEQEIQPELNQKWNRTELELIEYLL